VLTGTLRFIAKHGREPLNVDDVATAAAMSRRAPEQQFQQTMQRTFGDELLQIRLARARRPLVKPDEPLSQLASESGLSS
jgi:transcriptional regulator GlxA family with amidase domain